MDLNEDNFECTIYLYGVIIDNKIHFLLLLIQHFYITTKMINLILFKITIFFLKRFILIFI